MSDLNDDAFHAYVAPIPSTTTEENGSCSIQISAYMCRLSVESTKRRTISILFIFLYPSSCFLQGLFFDCQFLCTHWKINEYTLRSEDL